MLTQPHVSHGAHHAPLLESTARLERELALLLLAPVGAFLVGLTLVAMAIAVVLDLGRDSLVAVFGKAERR